MAGRRELSFPKTSVCSLKEQVARKTLRNVRLQGHTYVDLRKDGKREVFFCTLCLAPCYGDSVLFRHLNGNLHTERLAVARATLLKPNPWPFNDGMVFFNDLCEKDKSLPVSNSNQVSLLDNHSTVENPLAIVSWQKNSGADEHNFHFVHNGEVLQEDTDARYLNDDTAGQNLVIPGVLCKDEVSNLEVTYIGVAQIAARLTEKDGNFDEFHRIWCEWLGKMDSSDENGSIVSEHEFAVVTFSYNYNLGRKGVLEEIKYLLPSSPHSESEDTSSSRNRKRKSFSDPEDVSEFLSSQYDSSGEECQSSNSSNARLLPDGHDDQLLCSRILNGKTMRRELRRQHSLAAERMCDICQQKMLPGKDVAALLNTKTGRLACSSRNFTGAFHVFHVSCLIHWILLCELEIYVKPTDIPKVKRRSRKKGGGKQNENGKNKELTVKKQTLSAFCPECQGTGMHIKGDDLEKPTVPLSEIFKYKIKSNDARKAWFKSPEVLQNCSIGFCFPRQSETTSQEKVSPLKFLRFYRAIESRPCTTRNGSLL